MVYIDSLFDTQGWSSNWPFKEACHLMADSKEELIEFARKLKLKDSWIQCTSILHYDLTKGKRFQAIKLGAKEVDNRFRPENYKKQIEDFKKC